MVCGARGSEPLCRRGTSTWTICAGAGRDRRRWMELDGTFFSGCGGTNGQYLARLASEARASSMRQTAVRWGLVALDRLVVRPSIPQSNGKNDFSVIGLAI